jgi:hypothetical protein
VRWDISIHSHAGYGVAFDPGAVTLPIAELVDLETLQVAAAAGTVAFWPAVDEETLVSVLVDEPLPAEFARVAIPESRGELDVRTGSLWIADPAYLHTPDRPLEVPPISGRRLAVRPGRYRVESHVLSWPPRQVDDELRRSVGPVPVAVRDGLGLGTFFLAMLTVIGLPVYTIGRMLDDGLGGAGEALAMGAAVLVPIWIVVILAWRLPVLRAVNRADAAVADRHPDIVVALTHHRAS